jgi:hypothetical protein
VFGALEDADLAAQRAGLVGVGDAEEADEGGAEGRGEVHAAAVVAEDAGGERQDGGEFLEGGLAGEIHAIGGGGGGDLLADVLFPGCAQRDDGAAGFGHELGGGEGVVFGGPLLRRAAGGAGQQGNPWLGQGFELFVHALQHGGGHGKAGGDEGAAVGAGEEQVEVFKDLVFAAGAHGGLADIGEHEVAREVAGHADAFWDAGHEGGEGRAERVGQDIGHIDFQFAQRLGQGLQAGDVEGQGQHTSRRGMHFP